MQLPRAVDGEEVSLAPPVNAPLLPASRRAPPHPTPPRGRRRRTAEAEAEAEGLEAATQFSGEGRGRAGVPLAAGRSPRRAGRWPSWGPNEAAGGGDLAGCHRGGGDGDRTSTSARMHHPVLRVRAAASVAAGRFRELPSRQQRRPRWSARGSRGVAASAPERLRLKGTATSR
jgi:hypothetical protein